ncbi:hypothetical protein CEP51_002536 [Fusarium floridanum]|uniref:Uncharacterized protein n=1 Tax=Fusarium floridanum TaxID=1325733 RepID=A0A428SAW6_9HYPO|nr:hypothetical protein CEP51_002536 [Fusarium floridanum]
MHPRQAKVHTINASSNCPVFFFSFLAIGIRTHTHPTLEAVHRGWHPAPYRISPRPGGLGPHTPRLSLLLFFFFFT